MPYDDGFTKAVKMVLESEGGYVNHADDPGGETNFGISKRAYPNVNIAALTKEQAIRIYYDDYWLPISRVVSTPAMLAVVFDAAVNHGVSRAIEWALKFKTPASYMANRFRFWADLAIFPTFGRGWTRRGAKVLALADEMDCTACDKRVAVMVDNRPFFARLMHAFFGGGTSMIVTLKRDKGEEEYTLLVRAQ